ncbi:MAG TPA: hypothetical protein ENH57_03400 [Actinobacteria bacterium]|nr:hypothetical protein [Actinomycetota bacterium]
MEHCSNHPKADALYKCSQCGLYFCTQCLEAKKTLCKKCAKMLSEDSENKISMPVIIFISVSSLLILTIVTVAFLPSKNRVSGTKLTSSQANSASSNNQIKKTDHFSVKAANNELAIKEKSEEYYQAMPSLTGLPSGESLELDKIKLHILKDKKEYVKETGKPSWSEGFSDYKKKEIFIVDSDGLLISILPHEISHLFFDTHIGYENKDFNWLDEGLATLVQVGYDDEQARSFSEAMDSIRNGAHIPIEQMSGFTLSQSTPTTTINIYYAQSLSVVDYLKQDYRKWRSLLKKLKSGLKFKVALKASYDESLSSLESKWLESIKQRNQVWEKE